MSFLSLILVGLLSRCICGFNGSYDISFYAKLPPAIEEHNRSSWDWNINTTNWEFFNSTNWYWNSSWTSLDWNTDPNTANATSIVCHERITGNLSAGKEYVYLVL